MFDRWKSDIDLLKASRNGNAQAFGVLVSRYQALICAITYGATGDSGRSEELAQDAFLRAWRGLGQLQDLSKFRAWLCSIARNTVQNWFRSQGRDVAGRAASLEAAAEATSRESGPEEVVMFEEQQALIRQALEQMPEGVREPLILFYREGKSTREVAVQLGLTEEAARQRIYRGRSLLREQVAGMIENTITRTRPGKAFTAAVIASIVSLGFKGSATAAAATAGSYGVTSILSGLTAKVVAVAVGAVIVAGGIVAYKQINGGGKPADQGRSEAVSPVARTNAPTGERTAAGSEISVAASSMQTASGVEASPTGRDRRSGIAQGGADTFEFQSKGVLSGRVTDVATGVPVSGARLTILSRRVYTTITDANGFYSFAKIDEAGDYSVAVSCEEYLGPSEDESDLTVHLGPDTQIVKHLQLHKACMVDVWVVDANGAGIPGATVVGTLLADDRMREMNRAVYSRTTDPNGYILLGGFPSAETDYLITAWHTVATGTEEHDGHLYTLTACDYAPGKATVGLTDPNVIRQVRIVLERGAPVQARVEYSDGVPAANAEIAVAPAWWHCTHALPGLKTGEDGTLTLGHIVEGLHDISVRTPTSETGFMSQKVLQAQLPTAGNEPLVVQLPGKSPQSLVSIRGSLVFRGEKLPDSVRITMMSPSGAYIFLDVTRKPDGRLEDTFAIERLEPGVYSLTFSGENIEETTIDNVVAPTSDLRVELPYVPRLKLAGNVVDVGSGKPIDRFRVRVKKLQSLRGPLYAQPNLWVDFENERGDFSADLVGPGIYQIQVAAEGYAPAWSEPISTDALKNIVVTLSAGGAISGRVVNDKGEPLSGATVIPLSLAGGNMPETQDLFLGLDGSAETVNGSFTLPHVPAGIETIQVVHPGYASRRVEGIRVDAGRTSDNVEIVLSAGGTIEGYVYDLQGNPQAGQALYVQDAASYAGVGDEEAGRKGQAVTDANGFYRIERLPSELCYLERADKGQSLGVVCRMVVPRDGQVARVDLGGVPLVRGRIVLDGIPLAGARLLIGPVHTPDSGAFTCYATTDEQGGFAFGGATPGVYSIYRQQSADRTQWLAVGTVAVADGDVDIGVLPANASNLYVTFNSADAVDPGGIDSVFLTKEPRLWSTPTGIAEAPSAAEAPYVIKGIEPGTYFLNVKRRDQVIWQQQVELDAGKSRWELSVELPSWKAGVSGGIRGGSRALVVWREQKDVFAVVQPAPDGAYRVQHLPAGRYFIGEAACALYDVPPMAEMQLQEGQETTLDLDLSTATAGQTGFVLVQAVDEHGWVCDNAQIRLEGPLGAVEPVYTGDIGRGFLTVPGAHALSVQASGYQDVARKVNVKPFDPYAGRPQNLVICLSRK